MEDKLRKAQEDALADALADAKQASEAMQSQEQERYNLLLQEKLQLESTLQKVGFDIFNK